MSLCATRRILWLLVVTTSIVGPIACARPQWPEVETGPDAEVTSDGLYRVRGSGFANAWLKPDARLASYGTIVLSPPLVAYKRPPKAYGSTDAISDNYPLSERQMEDFKRYLVEAFRNELDQSAYYRVVDAPEDDTLRIDPAIVDLVVMVPTDNRAGRARVYASTPAVMTILLELRDAASGEVLARFAERRSATAPGQNTTTMLTWSNAVNDSAALRTTFRGWASTLRQRLDRVHEVQSTASAR